MIVRPEMVSQEACPTLVRRSTVGDCHTHTVCGGVLTVVANIYSAVDCFRHRIIIFGNQQVAHTRESAYGGEDHRDTEKRRNVVLFEQDPLYKGVSGRSSWKLNSTC